MSQLLHFGLSLASKMLKSIVECKLNTNFLIIQDDVEIGGQDLFVAFLRNHAENKTVNSINLLCYENPPEFYLQNKKYEKVTSYNFFSDPCGWNNDFLNSPTPASSKSDLSLFISDSSSNTVFFIDSLSALVTYHGFYSVCRNLRDLKLKVEKVICLAHGDLFGLHRFEELSSLSSTLIKLEGVVDCDFVGNYHRSEGKVVNITHKKSGGKIVNQKEIIGVNDDFIVSSKLFDDKKIVSKLEDNKNEIKNLTTFKLGLDMSESEKQAKNHLVLPYLRSASRSVETGKIIYNEEEEDDPDDDLDI